MSIDGKWIKKNEVRELRENSFVKNDIFNLKLTFEKKSSEIESLFNKLDFYFEKENFNELFPDDSFEMTELKSCPKIYRECCRFDLNDTVTLKKVIEAFDNLIPVIQQIVNRIQVKFYPGINSRDYYNARRQYMEDRNNYFSKKFAKHLSRLEANNISETLGRKTR